MLGKVSVSASGGEYLISRGQHRATSKPKVFVINCEVWLDIKDTLTADHGAVLRNEDMTCEEVDFK